MEQQACRGGELCGQRGRPVAEHFGEILLGLVRLAAVEEGLQGGLVLLGRLPGLLDLLGEPVAVGRDVVGQLQEFRMALDHLQRIGDQLPPGVILEERPEVG